MMSLKVINKILQEARLDILPNNNLFVLFNCLNKAHDIVQPIYICPNFDGTDSM